MAEYIDKSKIQWWNPTPRADRNYQTFNLDDAYDAGYDEAMVQIEKLPAADVRENKRGRWIKTEDGDLKCSECGHISCDEIYEYEPLKGSPCRVLRNPYFCAKCGADMRGNDG